MSATSADAATSATLSFVEQLGRDLATGNLTLPSLPDAVLRIQSVLDDPQATSASVARAVQTDPAFAARLVQLANSALLGRGSEPLTDLERVIARVGFEQVRQVAIALAARQMMNASRYQAFAAELRELWEHSVETAAVASLLAARVDGVSRDEALLAGLMHDIGTFYIYANAAEHPAVFPDAAALEEAIECWHTGIGQAILAEWGFPERMVQAVDEHELIEREHAGGADLGDVVLVANLLARWERLAARGVDLQAVSAFGRLGIEPEAAVAALADLDAELAEVRGALG